MGTAHTLFSKRENMARMTRKGSKKAGNAGDRYNAPALDKGLDIMELFATEDEPMALSDVARKLDRSVGEIFRMVATLERRGYLKLDRQSDLYEMTLKMFRLSHRHMPVYELSSASAALMKRLAKRTSQSCHVAVPFNGQTLIIVQENSPTSRGFRVRLGAAYPLSKTCSGKILLAFAPDDDRIDMLKQEAKLEKRRKVTPDGLDDALEKVRKHGYVEEKSSFTKGVTDLGCPIFGHNGELTGALTRPYLGRSDGEQVDIAAVREMLIDTATEISERLGYDPALGSRT